MLTQKRTNPYHPLTEGGDGVEVRPETGGMGRPQGHLFCFDCLRLVALFMVVVVHVAIRALGGMPKLWSSAWAAANAYDSLCRCAVPLFVMISGALFLGRDISVRKLYSKYVLRIVRAFMVWSVFYAVVGQLRRLGHHVPLSAWEFVRSCLAGHFHLWFLFMIAGLYLIVPFLRIIAADERLCLLFLVLGFAFAILLPQTIALATMVSPDWGTLLAEIEGKTRVHFFLGYSLYFMWGYWLHNHPLPCKSIWMLSVLGGLGVVATFMLAAASSVRAGRLDETFYWSSNVNVFLPVTAIFAVCQRLFSGRKACGVCGRVVTAMAKHCFGAYLIHAVVLMALDSMFHLWALAFHPLWAIPATSVAAYVFSLAIAAWLSRIPLAGKWLF